MNYKRVSILNVGVSKTTYNKSLQDVSSYIKSKQKAYICVAAVHLIMECQKNPTLMNGVNRSNIVTPDGMPLVWLSRLMGAKKTERVYGPTLMLKICSAAGVNGWKIYLLGGAQGQGRLLSQSLNQRFPNLQIVGYADTPGRQLSPSQNRYVVRQINRSGAHIVFVGMGCPYQELWMIKNRKYLNANVLIGVGAAFNFLSGKERQAPRFFQKNGLEWFFRLLQNPSRLWHRYTITNVRFILNIVKAYIFKKNKLYK